MAKRSPISGYNHNVRYRGLIFHVQTEDSGVMSPHLFTHLFREGVIISTRKLVYDAGSDEGAIKSLMQAQHKAVLKDLKKGAFDDKIDVYLAGTPGLLPRGAIDPGDIEGAAAESAAAAEAAAVPPPVAAELSAPELIFGEDSPAAALAATATVGRPAAVYDSAPEIEIIRPELELLDDVDIALPRRASRDTDIEMPFDPSVPNIEAPMAMLDVGPTVPVPITVPSDGVPAAAVGGVTARTPTGSGQTGQPATGERRTNERMPAVNAATLPPIPARSSTRPPSAVVGGSRGAMPTPVVVSRPAGGDDARPRNESDAAEIFSPAPPSVDAPPGAERPGQYSQHRRSKQISVMPEPRPNPVAIPSGLGPPRRLPSVLPSRQPTPEKVDPAAARVLPPSTRPPETRAVTPAPITRPPDSGRTVTPPSTRPPDSGRTLTPPAKSDSGRTLTPPAKSDSGRTLTPPAGRPDSGRMPVLSRDGVPAPMTGPRQTEPVRSRTSTPARIQTGSPVRPHTGGGSGGVVMTRPAVIVGAPAKSPSQTRVRKAREDEGRGFGQGLISEKSLDEVILAYLSEDGDDK